ncbi:integrase, catalytic region, zinc finger, CCHC-type containing protein [Tanacetum coccineum]
MICLVLWIPICKTRFDGAAILRLNGAMTRAKWLEETGPYELVHVKFEISSWRGARVGVRTYLLGGAIDGSKANGIIHDPKLELESSRFTFDLVPLSYESVDVVVGRELVVGHRLRWLCHESVFLVGRKVGCVMDTLKFTAMPFGLTNAPAVFMELISRITKGREDVREVFQQRGSGAKRKLSRCGRNQMGYEPILALPEGADDFIVLMKDCMTNVMLYRRVGRRSEAKNEFEIDVRRSDLEMESGSYWLDKVRTSIWRDVRTLAIEEAYTTKYSIHPGADTMLCGFRLTNRWLSMKKDIASCGSKYLAYLEVEVEYQGSSGLLLQPETSMVDFRGNWNTHFREMSFSLRWGLSFEYGCASFEAWLWVVEGLTLERCSTFRKKDKLEPSYVGPFEILGWIRPIVIQLVLWIVDSGCSKHMTGNLQLLRNFVEKFMGTVRFGNDHFAAITSYRDYVQGNLTICHVYFVEGLGHNLFSVGQFCDGDLEVAFRSNTCYVRNLEGDDLLTGSRDSNHYTIFISEMAASSLVCLMSRATSTKSWLWHRQLSHLNFCTINQLTSHDLVDGLPKFKYNKNHLCSACEQGKSKKASFPPKLVPST